MKMQKKRSSNSKGIQPFLKDAVAALTRVGNILIIVFGIVYFGLRKLIFAALKKKNEQTLYQYVRGLERHLNDNTKTATSIIKSRAKKPVSQKYVTQRPAQKTTVQKTAEQKSAATKSKSESFYEKSAKIEPAEKKEAIKPAKKKEEAVKPAVVNKYVPKTPRIINALRIVLAAAVLGAVVFGSVVIVKKIIDNSGKRALAENNTIPTYDTSQEDLTSQDFTVPINYIANLATKEAVAALDADINAMSYENYGSEPLTSLEVCNDEPLDEGDGTATGTSTTPDAEETTPAPAVTLDVSNVEFSDDILIHEGDTLDIVAMIQERLMDLYYMDADEPTTYFGEVTSYALALFQRGHDLSADGIAGSGSLSLLFSDEATPYLVREGDYGYDIKVIKERLAELGYYEDYVDDKNFDEDTDYAVRVFQGRNGLEQDGIVGHYTTEVLFNGDARTGPYYSSSSSDDDDDSGGTSTGGGSSVSYDANSASDFVAFALSCEGKYTYVWGGKSPPGMDCSGFVYYCLKQTGNGISYMTSTAWASSSYATISSMDDVKAGDILCFDGHVAICIGNGKMIDSSSSQNTIRITNFIDSSYWNKKWVCGKRVFD